MISETTLAVDTLKTAAGMIGCNCCGGDLECEGTCTHAELLQIAEWLEFGEVGMGRDFGGQSTLRAGEEVRCRAW